MPTTKKGFTLIELLIVIGVIGLLASMVLVGLSGFRKSGRDARRISDMSQVRTVVERYFSKCGFYPLKSGGRLPTGCPDLGLAVSQFGGQKWKSEFIKELGPSPDGAGIIGANEKFPQDPLARGANLGEGHEYTYEYKFEFLGIGPGAGSGLKYVLRAKLEDAANAVLANDLDNTDLGNDAERTARWGGIECNDDANKNFYCVGL